MALCRLLREWRDDPERLAVATEAWTLAGYAPQWRAGEAFPERAYDDPEAWEVIRRARHRRHRRLLRAKARGLLMTLDAVAAEVERMRLHDAQVESAVIECRRLELDERIAKLTETASAGR
jgi:hypothetical protein